MGLNECKRIRGCELKIGGMPEKREGRKCLGGGRRGGGVVRGWGGEV